MSIIKRGDTLIEVVFAIVIFSLVSVISIALMNKGIATSQASLEVVMARNEIDAQAEALRFIQNSFLAERNLAPSQQQYVQLWRKITGSVAEGGYAILPNQLTDFNVQQCAPLYDFGTTGSISLEYGFVLNTRMLQPSNANIDYDDYYNGSGGNYSQLIKEMILQSHEPENTDRFRPTPVQPRIIYTNTGSGGTDNSTEGALDESDAIRLNRKIEAAEGIWIIAVRSDVEDENTHRPEYFDFHIRTCWNSVGRATPNTIGTIVRLYNPEIIEEQP